MRRVPAPAIALLMLSVFSFPSFLNGIIPPVNAASASFSFAASGDIGGLTVSTSTRNLDRLVASSPNFFLGLGDFSYDPSVTGDAWCSQFKGRFSDIAIISGDHDTGGHPAGFGETSSYERYVNGCPLTLGVHIVCGPVEADCYGKEYYFDYPAAPASPIARFIFAAPKLFNITGVCTSPCSSQTSPSTPCTDQYGCWPYKANDLHFNWTANAIDNARANGIGWVIVATHKLCVSSGDATCSMGIAFFNMLVQKKVDLIIQAHDNAYERSKQLGFNSATCPKMATDNNGFVVYNSGCIVDNGLGNYTRGAGSVVVVQGAWINDLYGVNGSATHSENIAEAPYFAKLMGKNTPGSGLGFTKYAVSTNKIDIQTSFSGSFSDKFSITTGLNPVPYATWSPQVPQVGQSVSFTGTATGGVAPYSFSWDFGDGSRATGATVSHSYSSATYFNVTLTAVDSANRTGTYHSIIALGSWNGAVPCSPTQSTLENVIGKILSPQRDPSVPSSKGADYSGGGFKLAGNQPFGSSPGNWPFSKRNLQPPCFANGISTFVELHNVTLTVPPAVATYDCRTAYDQSNGAALFSNGKNCDVVFSVGNASATSCPSCYMHRIYAEIDGDWNASGISPPIPPNPGQLIDVQGFVYWDPDSFNVSSHNWSGWELHPFTAWKPARAPLSVSMSASRASPSVGQQVTFTASVSGGLPPYSYAWKFGDGATGTGNPATHIYTAQGSYPLVLNVTDSANKFVVASQTVSVAAVLSADFTTSASPTAGRPASFTATVSGGTTPYSYNWNFGDGTAAGTSNPALHTYSIPGNYTVVLSVTDANVKTATASHIVNIRPASLAVDFNFTPASPSVGQSVNFTATATGGTVPYTFTWAFGDGSTASGRSVLHSYTAAGSFTAILTTSDSGGKTSTVSKTVDISAHGTTTIVTCSPSSVVANQSSTCTATVTDTSSSGATTPTGNVTFTPGGTCTLVSGSCSVTVTPSTSGTLSISASYNGDSAHAASAGSTSITVNKRATITAVSCSPASVQVGQSTTCTASVSDTSPGTTSAPSGTVGFTSSGLGSFAGAPCNLVAVNSTTAICNATYTPSGISARTDTITGTYTPSASDTVHNASSGTFLLDVTIAPLNPTSTSVSCTPSNIAVNQVTTCTAAVTDTSTLGAVAPTGTVSFTPSGSCALSSPSGASASCSVNITPTATGTLTVSATYGGDPTHNGSSNSTSVIVSPRTTTATVSCSPSTVVVGQSTSCIIDVTDTSPGTLITPSGTVTFTPNGSCTLSGSAGTASCSTNITPTAAGTLGVTTNYNGDTNHNGSEGSTIVTVNKRVTSTSVSCTPSTVANSTSTNCTATVTDTDVGTITTPTGSISLSSNSTGAFSSPTCTLAATSTVGVSKCSVTYTPGKTGSHGISGAFAGDSIHLAGSGSVTLTVVSQPSTQSYALIVSAEGNVFRFYQNGTLTLIAQPVTTALRKVAWKPDGSYALIVGDSAVLLKYDGTQLTTITTGITTGYNFWTVSWKPDGSYALIGGSAGLLLKYDGASTRTISNPFPTTIFSISWHPSGSYALLVGRSGLTLTYNRTAFRSFSSGTTYDLNTAAWNPNGQYALIGGLNGVVLRFNGTQVSTLNTSGLTGSNGLRAIAFNASGSIALLVGDSGMVLTYNGSTLTLLPAVTSSYLQSVTWSPSGMAYIVGGSGTVITYANGALTKLLSAGTFQFRGIAWKPA